MSETDTLLANAINKALDDYVEENDLDSLDEFDPEDSEAVSDVLQKVRIELGSNFELMDLLGVDGFFQSVISKLVDHYKVEP